MLSPFKVDAATRLTFAVTAFAFAVCLWIFAHTLSDYDLWGHLKFGLDYLNFGRIPSVDTYSYTAFGARWISHSWLFETAIAAAFKLWDPPGLCLFKLTLVMALLTMLFIHLRRSGLTLLWSSTLMLFVALVLVHYLLPLRPQLATYLLFTAELILLQIALSGKARALWLLPPLFALWANLHGGFVAGLALQLIWTLSARPTRLRLWMLLASFAATLCTPYGLELYYFLATTLSVPRNEISEWLPLRLLSSDGLSYFLVLTMAWGVIYLACKQKVSCRQDAAILLITACLPLLAARHLPLFVLAAAVVAAKYLAALTAKPQMPAGFAGLKNALAAVLSMGALALAALCLPPLAGVATGDDMPQDAVMLLKRHQIAGNLATLFDWGEYCIYHLHPSILLSTDGRREEVYSPAAQALTINFIYQVDDHDALLNRYPTDVVLAPKTFPVLAAMKQRTDFRLVFEDARSALFVRRGSPSEANLAGVPLHSPPAARQFP